MAVTKTHPIKSTLKAAIDYILNPEKTDGKLLASSFGCGLETADIEFAWTREAAGDRGTGPPLHILKMSLLFLCYTVLYNFLALVFALIRVRKHWWDDITQGETIRESSPAINFVFSRD